MRQIIIFTMVLKSLCCVHANAQCDIKVGGKDSLVYKKLLKMDFRTYKNRTVDKFLHELGYTYQKYIPTTKKPGYIDHVIFRYSDSLTVDIAVKDLGQKEPLNFYYKFKIDVFK